MPDYERLTDDEVLALANERQDLTVDAQAALDVELRRRSISPNDIQDYQAETVQLNETEVRNIGVPTTFKGTGRKFLGKTNYQYDALSDSEEFDTTLWFVLLLFPLFPLGAYRLHRQRRENWWQRIMAATDFVVVDKLSRNWEQILGTWIKAAAVLFLLRLIMVWLVYRT